MWNFEYGPIGSERHGDVLQKQPARARTVIARVESDISQSITSFCLKSKTQPAQNGFVEMDSVSVVVS